jgi:hypothetical protein
MITIDSVVTFSFGSIVGFTASELIKDRLARTRGIEAIHIVEFNKAAATFYTAFLDEIIFLEDADPKEVFIEKFRKRESERRLTEANELKTETASMRHRKAMIIFRPYIDKLHLHGFDAAWSAYNDWPKHGDDDYDFKSHLNRLLEYANPK